MHHLLSDTNIHLENKSVSRLFFVFLWLMYALVYMTKSCFAGALSKIVDEGALTLTQASWISASFYFVYAPLQIVGGFMADKYSPEKLIIIGLLGSAVSNLVIFFNHSFIVILISWIFNAIIQFGLWPSVFKIMSSQLVRSDLSKMVFLMSFSNSGGLIFVYIVSAFTPKWQYNFVISTITLTLLAVVLLIFCHFLNPIMKNDKKSEITKRFDNATNEKSKSDMWHIFCISGFFMLLLVSSLRSMVGESVNTLSSTMLSQSYEHISPTIGNLLSILIVIGGIVGTLLIKFVIFPRLIANEFVCYLLMLILAFPFIFILRFVGNLSVGLIVFSLCMINLFLTAGILLTNYFIIRYKEFSLNGTAAGIMNAATALGFALQYCLFGSIADGYGWPTVTTIWIILTVMAIICILLGIRPSIRFAKKIHNKNK
ncbi:MAG: MFS transporter [Clostridia bacterium]|nr:MFS transporter [Clostridia bacterium]